MIVLLRILVKTVSLTANLHGLIGVRVYYNGIGLAEDHTITVFCAL